MYSERYCSRKEVIASIVQAACYFHSAVIFQLVKLLLLLLLLLSSIMQLDTSWLVARESAVCSFLGGRPFTKEKGRERDDSQQLRPLSYCCYVLATVCVANKVL